MEMETEEILADPDTVSDLLTTGGKIFTQYGWLIFAGIVLIAIYWNRIQQRIDRWYDKRESSKYAEKYHKNPDLALHHMEGMERARKKMQDELDRKAIEHHQRKKQRENQLRLERLAKLEAEENGSRLGSNQPSTSGTLKPEYNPLMGESGSRYKPAKKSGCPGGGCGGGR